MHGRGPSPAVRPPYRALKIETTAPAVKSLPRETSSDAIELGGVRVGVIIPAYRVADHIERVIRGIPPWVQAIIVVEDKSPDDTAERVVRLADPRVTLVRHTQNQGVGGAVATGFAEALRARLDIVVKMDGDDQMDPAQMHRIIGPLMAGEADMTKGNRYSSLGSIKAMPLIRIVGNAGLTFLVKLASGYWNLFDPANGYLALRASALERLSLEQLPRRYFFESGLLIELGIQRAVVKDVTIPARYGDERSSLSVTRTLLGFPPRLMWGFLRRIFWRYFVHDFTVVSIFLALGLPMLLFGAAFGIGLWSTYHDTNEYTPPGLVMLAAMPIILGVQLLLQAIVLDIQNVPRTPLSPPLERLAR